MSEAILPGSRTAFIEGEGRPTIAFYSFLRDLVQKDVASIETSLTNLNAGQTELAILALYGECQ